MPRIGAIGGVRWGHLPSLPQLAKRERAAVFQQPQRDDEHADVDEFERGDSLDVAQTRRCRLHLDQANEHLTARRQR
jgi:hypothetical protein